MTQEFANRLRILRSSGASMSEMAVALSREFNAHITRNVVAGAINRLKLPLLEKKPPAGRQPRKAKAKRKHGWQPQLAQPKPAPTPPRDFIAEDAAIPIEQRCSLFQLSDKTCRWPVGEGASLFFCGGAPVDGYPYCALHCARAWVKGGAR